VSFDRLDRHHRQLPVSLGPFDGTRESIQELAHTMSQNDALHLAREFLGRMGSGAESAEIAKLVSENLEWTIAGDTGVLPWIGQKSG
jgi:hypothetical protein